MNWVAYLLAGALVLSATFFAGYQYATREYRQALLDQQQAVANAVHEKEVALQEKARAVGQLVEARRARGDLINSQVMDAIAALPMVTNIHCEFTPEVIELLNQAGHQ